MTSARVDALVAGIERDVGARTPDGQLPGEAVEALDVVYHALVFGGNPRGLELWREALWEGRVAPEARASVAAMLDHLITAVDRGETEAVSAICDCLQTLVSPA